MPILVIRRLSLFLIVSTSFRWRASNPVCQRPAGAVNQQCFAAILSLLAHFKAARESQGLTLVEVAERMGIDAPALSRWKPARG
jgi:hypothetical protein